jgi:hypothetical protein
MTSAPRGLQFVPQALILSSEPLVLALQPFLLLLQRLAIPLRTFCALAKALDLVACWRRIGARGIRHVDVMPDPRKKYKYGILDRRVSAMNEAAGTR